MALTISPVGSAADRRAFVDLPWTLYANDPNWRPPLKDEVHALISGPKRNPWFLHGRAAFFLARRGGQVIGRISAQVCDLVQQKRPGLGQWGLFESVDEAEVAGQLIATAEAWLREQGMTQAQGPISISYWDEPGLLVEGFDTPPKVMMGHHLPYYAGHIEAAGYAGVKDLYAWSVPVRDGFPEIVNRIVAAGERNSRIRIRNVDLDRFDSEARIILEILNEAWSDNWGFVPLTDAEVEHVGKKLKPIVLPHQVLIAEYEGEPVAFIISIPDLNQLTLDLNGRLLPFGWAKLLWRLRNPQTLWFRVPLMGVRQKLQATRTASMLAFMMIEQVRRTGVSRHGAEWAEIGWILEDNGPMISIAEAIGAKITKTYRIFEREL
ncbi:N-acetyltransferase [Sandaracinobacter sp. RS1-74]|uniref:N-acetyltransferase n=1 Tax=Sandaracinobacteroides sayramensis TaxID=2913411 RepID=UPI001EDC2478|nr:N-acetyltransferase [Sandaracinobacteroides sayramensis]